VATVSPSSVTFNACGDLKTLTVTPQSVGSATISLTQTANSTDGTFNLAPATFTVNVSAAAPANTAPKVTVDGVTGGASYNKGSVPAATCNVTDAEDGNKSFAAQLSAVTGTYASDGIGSQTASCSYTDGGGLTAEASKTYGIVDPSAPVITNVVTPASPDGSNGWYKSDVTVKWTVSDPQSPNSVEKTGCVDQNITSDQAATTYSCSATSAGGSAAEQSVTIKRDATPPNNFNFVGGPTAGSESAFGSVPPAPTCTADDSGSGLNSAGCVVTGYSDAVGTHTMTATATDMAGNKSTATRTYTVTKATQTITFGALADKTFGDANFTVSATGGNSGNPVTFAALGDCKVTGNTVQILGAGSCTITASQLGNGNYFAATDVSQTFEIAKANQAITFGALANKTFGDANFTVSATADSGLTVSFAAAGKCTIDANNAVTLTGAGSCTITASQAGDRNHFAATNVPRTFDIAKATPTIAWNPQALTYGTALGANQLNASASGVGGASLAGNFAYTPGTGAVLDAGSRTLSANFTPTNTADYNSVTNAQAQLTVNRAALTVTADNKSKIYSDPNPVLTGTLTGVVNGDKITANYTTTATQLSKAGPYPITAQLVDPDSRLGNYDVTNNPGTLTIRSLSTRGFFSPIDMTTTGAPIAWNTTKGGSTVPVKFELFKDANDPSTELRDTSYVDRITYAKIACTAGADDAIEELISTTATGQTTLRYDTSGDQFVYNWATPKVTSQTCYKLTMYSATGLRRSALTQVQQVNTRR
jgi:hypothetical protein